MKNRKFRSIRIRITIIVGLILTLSAVLLTVISIINANQSFGGAYGISQTNGTIPDNAVTVEDDGSSNTIIEVHNADTAQSNFAYSSIIYMFLIAAAGTTITYFYIKKATEPIRALDQVISGINANNLNTKVVSFKTNDEIQNLADSFNIMLSKLERSFNTQKEFTSNAAHELKTPLSSMKTSLQVLRLSQSPTLEEYEDNAEVMETCTEQLIDIVEDLLCLASEKNIALNDEIPLNAMFADIRHELMEKAELKNICIQTEPTDIVIYGNRVLLFRALYNLTENAIKYTKKDSTVKLSAASDSSETIIKVHDDGEKISKENQERIFEPFYRADSAVSAGIQGNGLGLSIVRTIIDKHHGSIVLDQSDMIGKTFVIHFPKGNTSYQNEFNSYSVSCN